jgi:Zn finger protein HypA/HybF involved in hydrogenase expression
MSENVQIINGVTMSDTDVKCPGCGATVKYDPATLKMVCPFCGTSKELPQPEAGAVIEELDFNTAIQRASVNWGTVRKLIVCSNCGGQSIYEASQVSGCCPFCGSTSVMPAAENEQIMAPGAVIPFAVDADKARRCFIDHLRRKRFVPRGVFNVKLDNFIGIYLPFWTYDTDTVSSYVASIGYKHKDSDGDTYYTYKKYKGVRNQFIDDMIVYATDKVQHPHISKVQNFYFDKMVPYKPEYLAGFVAERYTVGLNDGWERAKVKIAEKLKQDIGEYERVRNRGDRVGKVNLSTNYYNVKFKYLLAPMYLATYTYGGRTYSVAINGQSGETYCDAPSYLWKIILFIALGVITSPIVMGILRLILNGIESFFGGLFS